MNFIKKRVNKFYHYIIGVIEQARRVRWPSYEQLFKSTVTVIVFSCFFALFLALSNELIVGMFRLIGMKG